MHFQGRVLFTTFHQILSQNSFCAKFNHALLAATPDQQSTSINHCHRHYRTGCSLIVVLFSVAARLWGAAQLISTNLGITFHKPKPNFWLATVPYYKIMRFMLSLLIILMITQIYSHWFSLLHIKSCWISTLNFYISITTMDLTLKLSSLIHHQFRTVSTVPKFTNYYTILCIFLLL